MDNFREEIIVRRTGKVIFTLGYIFAFVTMIFSGLPVFLTVTLIYFTMAQGEYSLNVTDIVMVVLPGIIAILLWRKKDDLRLEYEYTLTNGEMDFAKVLGNKRRKHLLTLRLKTAEQGGPVESEAYTKFSSMPDVKKIDYTINTNVDYYFIYYVQNGVRTILTIEPSPRMIEMMRIYNRNFADMPATLHE